MSTTTLGTFLVICRKSFVPLTSDNDEVIPDNLGALKLGLMALQYEDKSDPDRAALFMGPNKDPDTRRMNGKMKGCIDLLDEEREETEQAEVPTISFNRDFGGGSVPSIR